MRDELCRRFMAIPGVGPVTALSLSTAIDDPALPLLARCRRLFRPDRKAKAVRTSIDVQGRITKAGDPDVRRALYEAAWAMLTRYEGSDDQDLGPEAREAMPRQGGS